MIRKAALVLLALATLAASRPVLAQEALSIEKKRDVLAKMSEILIESAYVPGADFNKWTELLDGERTLIEAASNERDFVDAINQTLRKLGYSHVQVITPQAASARKNRQAVGIGIQIQPEAEGIRVISVFEKSPAAKAGLVTGDLIIEADGQPAAKLVGMSGTEGSTLKIKVKRGDGTIKDFTIVRRKYDNSRPETLTWNDKETAILKIPTFDVGYNRERIEDLVQQSKRAKNLILDLRSNPGGAVLNLMHLLGLTLPEGTNVGTFISKRTVEQYVKETSGSPTDLAKIGEWSKFKLRSPAGRIQPFKGKIAVLVNQGSGSASEIVAAALRENIQAPVIGMKSAGAVLVSVLAALPEGFLLQYPITDFVTAKGLRLEGAGLIPDAEAPALPKFGEKDEAVLKAIAVLSKGTIDAN